MYQHRIDSPVGMSTLSLHPCCYLGKSHPDEQNFEATVKKMVDCRLLGFGDGFTGD